MLEKIKELFGYIIHQKHNDYITSDVNNIHNDDIISDGKYIVSYGKYISSYEGFLYEMLGSGYTFEHKKIESIKSEFISIKDKNILILKCPKISESEYKTIITIKSKKQVMFSSEPYDKFFFRLFDENGEELHSNCEIEVKIHKLRNNNDSYSPFGEQSYSYCLLSKGNFIYNSIYGGIILYPCDELIFDISDKNINIDFDKSIILLEFDCFTKPKSLLKEEEYILFADECVK